MTDPNPALERLDVFVGEWKVELAFPTNQPGMGTGRGTARASFEWLEGGAYLMYRLGDRAAGLPYAVCVIGRDESADIYTMLYFDDRGVSRIYQMSLEGREWKQWRQAPSFSQRFFGTFSDDGNTIIARWEKSSDGTSWEHDFNMTYTRIK
jgi:hypothetical protein